MKRLLIGLLFATSAFGQTPVIVTGFITDAGNNPATSGYVQFDIVPKASSIHYFVSGIGTITQTVQCGINGTGFVKSQANLANPCTVWGNDVINPANTQYKITFAPGGTITNVVTGECITGAGYSLNSPVFCPIIQISPQQAIIRSNPFQTNIIPSAGHTFNIGTSLLPYAAVYTDNLFVGGVIAFSNVTSISPNPAQNGVIRLANVDNIAWRNGANSGDLSLGVNPTNTLVASSFNGILTNTIFAVTTAQAELVNHGVNPALSGVLRLATGDSINWRNQSNTGDLSLGLVTPAGNIPGNTFTLGSQGLSASFFSDTTQVSATGGLIRLSSGNSINWRNTANVGDIVIQKTGGDSLDISAFRGVFMPSTSFASINNPAPTNGLFYYCSDCTIANPCAGGGTGALAKRLAGVWVCN